MLSQRIGQLSDADAGSHAALLGAGSARPAFPLRFLAQSAQVPDWQLFTQILHFLLESRDPEDVAHRGAAALGLLPQIAWADLDGQADAGPGSVSIQLGEHDEPGAQPRPRWLEVRLVDANDAEARALARALLGTIAQLYERECEAQRLLDAAYTDMLTGLWNRRGFTPFVDQAIARTHRQEEKVALLLIDVDNFKHINDRLGHAAGDLALKTVGDVVQKVVRPCDLGARLGGDEIAILLSGSDAAGAMQVARRLRDALERANPLAHSVTLSIGIADAGAIPSDCSPEQAREALLQAADEALYAAKNNGRDRAEVHSRCIPAAND